MYVCPSVHHTFIFSQFLQSCHKMSLMKVTWHVSKSENYVVCVTHKPLGSMKQGEAEPHTLQYQAKGEAKLRILKLTSVFHHLQESLPSKCVCQHTQDLPAKLVLPRYPRNVLAIAQLSKHRIGGCGFNIDYLCISSLYLPQHCIDKASGPINAMSDCSVTHANRNTVQKFRQTDFKSERIIQMINCAFVDFWISKIVLGMLGRYLRSKILQMQIFWI